MWYSSVIKEEWIDRNVEGSCKLSRSVRNLVSGHGWTKRWRSQNNEQACHPMDRDLAFSSIKGKAFLGQRSDNHLLKEDSIQCNYFTQMSLPSPFRTVWRSTRNLTTQIPEGQHLDTFFKWTVSLISGSRAVLPCWAWGFLMQLKRKSVVNKLYWSTLFCRFFGFPFQLSTCSYYQPVDVLFGRSVCIVLSRTKATELVS
jgi:hypothetical protein